MDTIALDFPRSTLREHDDGHVSIVLRRDALPALIAFLQALERGYTDVHMQPAGRG